MQFHPNPASFIYIISHACLIFKKNSVGHDDREVFFFVSFVYIYIFIILKLIYFIKIKYYNIFINYMIYQNILIIIIYIKINQIKKLKCYF